MNKAQTFFLICLIFTLQSCLFGVGLVEEKISDNIFLTAINEYDELSIWHSLDNTSIRNLLVPETVFAIGNDNEFIIVKTHPKNSNNEMNRELIFYHIIEIDKIREFGPSQSVSMVREQFEIKRKELQIPDKLDFEIVFKQNE
ncbi:hypothetical protein QSV08_12405 [Maribacter sp. BPC-D8]|uniref:hypothetical protein n=1 Tax=Maribacter sp. BPC-D8 TaxID=3053613 RepID=UPI002B495187|nr:hypothetical protein [Maribacter sp. BPC-D8]WRI28026.1 hypothetical protein QSV08_12405 [Maribacter sp. BPC-D8]